MSTPSLASPGSATGITPAAAEPPPTTGVWKEYKNAEGRPYWFHTVEKRSIWEKPDELKTPRERVIASSRWKAYKSDTGREYYVNSDTKETTWNVPQELKVLFDAIPSQTSDIASPAQSISTTASPLPAVPSPSAAGATSGGPRLAPGPPPLAPPQLGNLTPTNNGVTRQVYAGPPPGFGPGPPPGAPPLRPPPTGPSAGVATPPSHHGGATIPTGPAAVNQRFASPRDAFRYLLSSHGISATATWEQTMRDLITDPLYKSLRTVADRKAVFYEHQAELKRQEEEEKRQKKAELRPAVLEVMRSAAKEERLKKYASWRTVKKVLGDQSEVQSAIDAVGETECQSFWAEVKKEIKALEESSIREMRHRNMDLLMSLLRTFEADTTTRWRDAHRTVLESSEWKQDTHLSKMEVQDMLIVFEEYIRGIEREETDRRHEEEKQRIRAERKRRDEFRTLMLEGREAGWVHSKTTWPQAYKRLKEDQRFTSMLGQKGSTPLDLFFDTIDACDRSIEARTASVEALIKLGDRQWEGVAEETTWDIFLARIQVGLDQTASSPGQDREKWISIAKEDRELKVVYEELHHAASRSAREARKRHERHIRHLVDDARYGLKKYAPDSLITFAEEGVPLDSVRDTIEELKMREWRRLDDEIPLREEREDVKRTIWEKFCRRQKEKADERAAAAAAAEGSSSRRRRSMGASEDDRGGEAGSDGGGGSTSRKRKSDVHAYSSNGRGHQAAEYDERERERDRARRREDRDSRRRGGGGGGYEDEDEGRRSGAGGRASRERSSRRREEEGEVLPEEENARKKTKVDLPSTAASNFHPTIVAGADGGTTTAGSSNGKATSAHAADDDDKEEGEV